MDRFAELAENVDWGLRDERDSSPKGGLSIDAIVDRALYRLEKRYGSEEALTRRIADKLLKKRNNEHDEEHGTNDCSPYCGATTNELLEEHGLFQIPLLHKASRNSEDRFSLDFDPKLPNLREVIDHDLDIGAKLKVKTEDWNIGLSYSHDLEDGENKVTLSLALRIGR